MQKLKWLVLTMALLGGAADAGAQHTSVAGKRGGFLGIRYDESLIIVNGQRDPARVVVKEVSKDSPAEKAGIRAGDEIVRINGLDASNGKFSAIARTLVEGDTVQLRVKRGNQERDYTMVAAARPAGYHGLLGDRHIIISTDSIRERMKGYLESARIHLDSVRLPRVWVMPGDSSVDIRIQRFGELFGDSVFFRGDSSAFHRFELRGPEFEGELGPGVIFHSMELGRRAIAGAEFTELDPAMKPYFNTDRGILTLRVLPATPAARAGLLAGDVVVKANDRPVGNVAELRATLLAPREKVKLEVIRKGETRTLELQVRRPGTN